jgi:hypothetical protein
MPIATLLLINNPKTRRQSQPDNGVQASSIVYLSPFHHTYPGK